MAREELWTRAAIVGTETAGWLFLVLGTAVRELGRGLRLRDWENTERSVFRRTAEQS